MDECHPISHGFWEVVVRICRLGRDCVKASASGRRRAVRAHFALAAGLFLCLSIFLVPGASAQRSQLRPGWNAFTPQEDISLGKRAATDAEKQLALCNAPRVDAYLTQLGTPPVGSSIHSNFIAKTTRLSMRLLCRADMYL